MSDEAAGYRLSPAQLRQFRVRTAADDRSREGECVLSLSGVADTDRIVSVLRRIVGDSEILRTRFVRSDGIHPALQVIEPDTRPRVRLEDLQRHAENRETQLDSLLSRFGEEPLDPFEGPPLHVQIVRVGEDEHCVQLRLNALCGDRETLVQTALLLLEGCADSSVARADCPQFADIAEWENQALEADAEAAAWLTIHVSDPEPAEPLRCLPTRRWSRERTLDPALAESVEKLAGNLGLRVEDVLVAAWSISLARLSEEPLSPNRDRSSKGTARGFGIAREMSGRNLPEFRHALGPLSYLVRQPLEPKEHEGFVELCRRAAALWEPQSDAAVCALAVRDWAKHDDAPTPVGFEWHTLPDPVRIDGVRLEWIKLEGATEFANLSLQVSQRCGRLFHRLGYDPTVVDDESILPMAREYEDVLAAAVSDPERSLLEAIGSELGSGNQVLSVNSDPDHFPTILAEAWSEVLGVHDISPDDNFFELGGDSIQAILVVAKARARGCRITGRQVLATETLEALGRLASLASAQNDTVRRESVEDLEWIPLTPIQQRFVERFPDASECDSNHIVLEVPAGLEPELLKRAWIELIARHDALRMVYRRGDSGWTQTARADGSDLCFQRLDLSGLQPADQQRYIHEVVGSLSVALDHRRPPLLAIAHCVLDDGTSDRMIVAMHGRFNIDAVSFRFLASELTSTYAELASGQPVSSPTLTTSYAEWARVWRDYVATGHLDGELQFWLEQGSLLPPPLPGRIKAREPQTHYRCAGEKRVLPEREMGLLLRHAKRAVNVSVEEVLLCAFSRAMRGWTSVDSVYVEIEGHGRHEMVPGVDLSGTIGWFTSHFPIRLDAGTRADGNTGLLRVAEQLRAIPNRGMGFGALRYLSPSVGQKLQEIPEPEISFVYLGRFSGLSSGTGIFDEWSSAAKPRLDGRVCHRRFEILLWIADDRLEIHWAYDPASADRPIVEALADAMTNELHALAVSIESDDSGGEPLEGGQSPEPTAR